ncbi:hypothetical protein F443_03456 [Phytophthora nicotianae P1569]|uniref:Uncharacterized protein n=1 Tax=Phytophthora nicotianae P1569 TaxID=1317065 RepID=V9FTB1_PHYNI|nr:hypothetical protein F443_03456 [Phytophthora nicotianae P1569]
MTAKRGRQQESDDTLKAKATHKVYISAAHECCPSRQEVQSDVNTFELQQRPRTTLVPGQFFESPFVRAWYSGETNEAVSLDTMRTHADPSVTPNTQRYYPDSLEVGNLQLIRGSFNDSRTINAPNKAVRVEKGIPTDTSVYCQPELFTMNQNLAFVVPNSELLNAIKAEAIDAMSAASEDRKPCCVCELAYDKDEISRKELTAEFIERMKKCLKASACVPTIILSQYSVSHIDGRLKGLLLYSSGKHLDRAFWC